jgi:hypothetical protein
MAAHDDLEMSDETPAPAPTPTHPPNVPDLERSLILPATQSLWASHIADYDRYGTSAGAPEDRADLLQSGTEAYVSLRSFYLDSRAREEAMRAELARANAEIAELRRLNFQANAQQNHAVQAQQHLHYHDEHHMPATAPTSAQTFPTERQMTLAHRPGPTTMASSGDVSMDDEDRKG